MLNSASNLAFLDGLGGPEMLLVFIMSLMLFGGKKLPELARSVGKAVREFKRAASGVEEEIRKAMDAEAPPPDRPKPPAALPAAGVGAALSTDSSSETDDYHDEHHHDDYHHEEYDYDHDEDHKDLETTTTPEEPKVDEAFEAGDSTDEAPVKSDPVDEVPANETPIKETPAQDAPDEDSPESPTPKP